MSTSNVVAAIFPTRDAAVATRDLLGEDHFHYRWLAVTEPSDSTHVPHNDLTPEQHELAESSDGAVGAVGRFLSGAGSSLRKALEDHGVTQADAEAIDLATPPSGAILVVHAKDDQMASATQVLQSGGGRVYSGDPNAPLAASRIDPSYASPNAVGAGAASSAALSQPYTPASAAAYEPSSAPAASNADGEAIRGADDLSTTSTDGDGEYVITKRIVSSTATVEIPVDREEIFMERRAPRP